MVCTCSKLPIIEGVLRVRETIPHHRRESWIFRDQGLVYGSMLGSLIVLQKCRAAGREKVNRYTVGPCMDIGTNICPISRIHSSLFHRYFDYNNSIFCFKRNLSTRYVCIELLHYCTTTLLCIFWEFMRFRLIITCHTTI